MAPTFYEKALDLQKRVNAFIDTKAIPAKPAHKADKTALATARKRSPLLSSHSS